MVATCCSAEIIDGVAEGRYLLAYNMLGSYALARAAVDPRIGVVAPDDYTLILARAALIPRWAENPAPARRFSRFQPVSGRGALYSYTTIHTLAQRLAAKEYLVPSEMATAHGPGSAITNSASVPYVEALRRHAERFLSQYALGDPEDLSIITEVLDQHRSDR